VVEEGKREFEGTQLEMNEDNLELAYTLKLDILEEALDESLRMPYVVRAHNRLMEIPIGANPAEMPEEERVVFSNKSPLLGALKDRFDDEMMGAELGGLLVQTASDENEQPDVASAELSEEGEDDKDLLERMQKESDQIVEELRQQKDEVQREFMELETRLKAFLEANPRDAALLALVQTLDTWDDSIEAIEKYASGREAENKIKRVLNREVLANALSRPDFQSAIGLIENFGSSDQAKRKMREALNADVLERALDSEQTKQWQDIPKVIETYGFGNRDIKKMLKASEIEILKGGLDGSLSPEQVQHLAEQIGATKTRARQMSAYVSENADEGGE